MCRVEQLSLLMHCCPLSAVKLIGSCPQLLSAPLADIQQQLVALCSIMGAASQPERVVPLLLWRPGLLLLPDAQEPQDQATSHAGWQLGQQQEQEQQREEQQQEQQQQLLANLQQDVQHQEQQQAAPATVDAVAQSLQHLTCVLGVPADIIHALVTRAPDLLQLGAAGPSAVSAAAASLEGSWLLGAAAGLQQRQQYQHELLQLLQPQQYSRGMKRRKLGQGRVGTAAGWYTAVQAVEEEVLRCQWWADTQQQQQQLGLQQLVLQAPGLLVLSAARQAEAGVHQQHSAAADAGRAGGYSEPDVEGAPAGLTARLQLLCDELLLMLERSNQHMEQQQQQQQQQQQAWQGSPGSPRSQPLQQQQDPHWWQQQQQQELAVALQKAAVLEPCILTRPPGWVAMQLQQLAAALQVPPIDMLRLLVAYPCLLWLTQDQIFEQIRVLCGILKLPTREVKHLLTKADATQLLLLHPEAVKKRFVAAAQAAGGDHHKVRQLIRNHPSSFLNRNVAAR
jgi:hypothetical protein